MLKKLAVLAAIAGASLALAPSASAEEPMDVWVEAGTGMYFDYDGVLHGSAFTRKEFIVKVRDNAEYTEAGVNVHISTPQIDVSDYEGDRWNCWDVYPGAIECHNPDTVVPGEEWPELKVRFDRTDVSTELTVNADNQDLGRAHFDAPLVVPNPGT